MKGYKSISIHLTTHFKLSSDFCLAFKEEIDKISHIPYFRVVGSLMYAMVCTRPDLSSVVSVVSCFIHNSGKDNWDVVKCILCYVKGSLNKCLLFDKSESNFLMLVIMFTLIIVVILT